MSCCDLPFVENITKQWDDLLADYGSPSTIWVAVSGGMDSMMLLHWLRFHSGWPNERINVMHVDHQLHPSSVQWADHVQKVCDAWSLRVLIKTVSIERQGYGLEAAARKARYGAFEKHVGPCDWLVLGHHQGDRVESLLLHLLRGAGPRGLSSMRPYHRRGNLTVVRPLLYVTKADLEVYSTSHQLRWVEDPSNQDCVYDRNFIRRRILPLLEERWPHAQRSIASSARWLQESDEYQERRVVAALESVSSGQAIDLRRLARLSLPEQKQIVRYWLRERTGFAPGQTWLLTFFETVVGAGVDAQPLLAWCDGFVRRYRGGVYWIVEADNVNPLTRKVAWPDLGKPLTVPGRDWSIVCIDQQVETGGDNALLQQPSGFSLRSVSGGMPFHPQYRDRKTTVKKCFQELGVPPWERAGCIGVFQQDVLVAMILTDQRCVVSRDCPLAFEIMRF